MPQPFNAKAIIQEAERLRTQISANDRHHNDLLNRLISDPRMKRVWAELYKKDRTKNNEFRYPAATSAARRITRLQEKASELRKVGEKEMAAALEAEAAWEKKTQVFENESLSEQDRGAQLFLFHAWHCAIQPTPIHLSSILSEINRLREIAVSLRNQAQFLISLKLADEAKLLNDVADACELEANLRDVDHDHNDPWVIVRDRGDSIERTFVTSLSIATSAIFGKSLHGVLVHVANVVFERNDIGRSRVSEWLRASRDKRSK